MDISDTLFVAIVDLIVKIITLSRYGYFKWCQTEWLPVLA